MKARRERERREEAQKMSSLWLFPLLPVLAGNRNSPPSLNSRLVGRVGGCPTSPPPSSRPFGPHFSPAMCDRRRLQRLSTFPACAAARCWCSRVPVLPRPIGGCLSHGGGQRSTISEGSKSTRWAEQGKTVSDMAVLRAAGAYPPILLAIDRVGRHHAQPELQLPRLVVITTVSRIPLLHNPLTLSPRLSYQT